MWGVLASAALGASALVPASAALGAGVPVNAAGPDAAIEAVIDAEMPASGVPGLAYAVVAGGEVTSVGARGVAVRGGDELVTPDTPFLTGSVSKSFTALAVLQLVEAGRVDLDAEVARYLDDFSGTPAGGITIRQLLSHTSGFSTLQGNASHTDAAGGTDALARQVGLVAGTEPAYAPDERWEYSNTNYQVLGRLIEVVSGASYQDYVTTRILAPVGMEHSFVADGQVHDSMATGHRPWFGTKRPLAQDSTELSTAPQGGVVASAGDLARYLQVLMNGQDDVLSAEGKAQMMRPASAASPFYGLGWFIDSANGTVWHAGSTPGFESLATMVPADQDAVVVLVNGGSGVGFQETTQLRNSVTATALGLAHDGEGSRVGQKALLIAVVALPIGYLLSMLWAWRHRAAIRRKRQSGIAGRFSLWFPLLTTTIAAWVILALMPRLLGSPLGTITLFQPDLGTALTATAVTGVLWAAFRLALAHSQGPTLPDTSTTGRHRRGWYPRPGDPGAARVSR